MDLTFKINEAAGAYGNWTKLKTKILLDREGRETRDIVSISTEGKKKQIINFAQNEVLDRIRDMRKSGETGF